MSGASPGKRPVWISAAIRMSSSMRRFSRLSSSRRTFSIFAAATLASAVSTRRSSSVKAWACWILSTYTRPITESLPSPAALTHRGAHIAVRMPEARIESSLRKRASSSTFGSSSETRSSITRRAIERLTRVSTSPLWRERPALMCGTPPSSSRIAPRSAVTASSSSSSTRSNSSPSGRCTTSSLAALLRIASTRFCRCSSAASIAGRVLIAESSRTEKTRVPSGSRSSSSSPPSSAKKVSVCSPSVITSPGRSRCHSRTGSPFSSVPFLLLRSLTQ